MSFASRGAGSRPLAWALLAVFLAAGLGTGARRGSAETVGPWIARGLSLSSTCFPLQLGHHGEAADPVAIPVASNGCTRGTYRAGTKIHLTPGAPAPSWRFFRWVNAEGASSFGATYDLTMPAMAYAVTAHYTGCYTLTLGHTGPGSDPLARLSDFGCPPGSFSIDLSVPLLASPGPDAGSSIAGWSGTDHDGSRSPDNSVTMTSNRTAGVIYGPNPPLGFFPLPPCRVLDTRTTSPLFVGERGVFPVGGACGVPATARAVSVNFTVTNANAAGNLLLVAGDLETLPDLSMINFTAGRPRSNNAMVALSSDGNSSVKAKNESPGGIDLIVDVNGYFQ